MLLRKLGLRAILGLAVINSPSVFGQSVVDASTLTGKFVLGYQAWHACGGDGKTLSGYIHWSHLNRVEPSPSDVVCDIWPDITELPANELFPAAFTNGNGQATSAYSCYLTNTVLRHFRWMRDYGLDGVALQRFTKDVFIDSTWAALKNTNLVNCRLGAETYGRVFFLMYDISNEDPTIVTNHLQSDWAYVAGTLQITNSSRYLKHRGKPLLGIWGLGFNGGLAVTPANAQTIIDYFKGAGCTVLGGVPANWRTLNGDSQTNAGWASVYHSFSVLSPWTVGRYTTDAQADGYKSTITADLADCQANGIDFLPVVFPGYSSHNLSGFTLNGIPRNGGRFFWRQIYNALSAGCPALYGAMFDEIDEGTALYKLSPTSSTTPVAYPTNQYQFFALDVDGYSLPSDWYLRVSTDGTLATHGKPLNEWLPITPTNTITVLSPNGGNFWTSGVPATVTWSTTGLVSYVNIDISTDGGATFRALAYNATNSGSKVVNVPYTASTNCLVRIGSTNGTPVAWSQTNFTIRVSGTNANIDLQQLWSMAPGTNSWLPNDTGNTARGLAYNAASNEVYTINTSIFAVNVLDGTTGTNKPGLQTFGISGGNFILDKIGVADDGIIYAGNVQTSVSSSSPFKLYRWANSNPAIAPVLAYSGLAGFASGLRVGDTLAVRGAGTNTQVLVGARTVSTVCLLTTADGTNFTAHTLNTDATPEQLGSCLAFGLGNCFWATTNGLPIARLNFDPISLVATTAQSFGASVLPPNCGAFAVDPANSLMAAIILTGAADQLNLYDLSATNSGPVLLSSWGIPGLNDNNFGLGAVAFGGNRLYALDTNNGLLAFRVTFPGGPTPLSANRSGTNVWLAWAASARGFYLQQRGSFTNGSTWQSVFDPVSIAGNQFVVTQQVANVAGFYRLEKP
ncbi:MAG: hypothetical protein C5B50_19805 [Verrucomicrobia bacterium]|nr:MAG: hypothetical protein C5B50_19805 [Verrucomicrobiota bacterium]